MSRAPTWVIVPVKALSEAKQRLSPVLPLAARQRLMVVMLLDVLAALRQVEELGPVLIVTPDAEVADVAQGRGAQVLREARATGHSAAAVAGFTAARAGGAAQALTLPADAPLVTPMELRALLSSCPRVGAEEIAATTHVTLVPSRDGDGTNALLVSPPDAFTPRFGPGSFARHRTQAAGAGIACRTVRLPGLGLDVDEPHDLYELMRHTHANPRYSFLEQYVRNPVEVDQS